ncbi:MAG: protein-glutamate methylesterase/protein-glutamine glutaminase [Patescibacteria group bacterium]
MPPVRVLVVDDSAFMRQVISRMLEKDPGLCVVGTARDGLDGLAKLAKFAPDVVTLDLEMPRMDGLTFLAEAMGRKAVPVIIVSSWAKAGAQQTLRALELGAVDFVTKPVAVPSEAMWDIAPELVAKIKAAALARLPVGPAAEPAARRSVVAVPQAAARAAICCIAASTGGPRGLQSIVSRLPAGFPAGVLLVQHLPVGFSRAFADRLGETAALPVKEAADGDELVPGRVYVAPAGMQTRVAGAEGRLYLEVGTEPASIFRPSADVTFGSIAESCGAGALGILLSGMGQDGARGLLALRERGARTVAEAEETCIIYGMPRAAVELGAAEFILPLWQIPEAVVSLAGPARDCP